MISNRRHPPLIDGVGRDPGAGGYGDPMARSSGSDWSLDNAEKLHEQHPRSFFIPSAQRRQDLRPDDMVRLVFLVHGDEPDTVSGERMWLCDLRRHDDGRYVGTLTNTPVAIQDLAAGDEVAFGPEHVIAVEDPGAIPDRLIAFAARRLVEDDALVPRYVYHDPADLERGETRDGRRASGWNLMVGDETDEELNDPASLLMPSLGWLAERYPAFGELVRTGQPGRQYEWVDDRYLDVGEYLPADE